MLNKEIVTVSFFRFENRSAKWHAFRSMGLSPNLLKQVEGLSFGKMLGSGAGNGFSIFPDFGTYGLLNVWKNQEAAHHFLTAHPFFLSLKNVCTEVWTTYLRVAAVHGEWEKQTPFAVSTELIEDQPVMVLTRATIHTKHLLNFWRFVPSVSKSMDQYKEGLIFSKGVGELPLVQQATISFWESSTFMKAYAYRNKHHREVIQKTRQLGWYKEEMFARFHPYKSEGSWNGTNPIAAFLTNSISDLEQ